MRAAEAARAGFAIGWARATAAHPITLSERAKTACQHLMAIPGDPGRVVEVALRKGQLHGMWAVVYDRRQKLEARYLADLRDALVALGKEVDWATRLRVRRESTPGLDPAQVAAAQALAAAGLESVKGTPAWNHVTKVIHDTLRAAGAEGRADALAQLADLASISIDFDLAYQAGYDALDGLQALNDEASAWMRRVIGDQANEVGRTIAAGWRDGLDATELESSVMDVLGAGRNAAGYVLDQMVGGALSDAATSTYAQAGLDQCDFLTAGDERVDEPCDAAESGNPWPLTEVPTPPLHGMCRCTLAPPADTTPVDPALFADYTT